LAAAWTSWTLADVLTIAASALHARDHPSQSNVAWQHSYVTESREATDKREAPLGNMHLELHFEREQVRALWGFVGGLFLLGEATAPTNLAVQTRGWLHVASMILVALACVLLASVSISFPLMRTTKAIDDLSGRLLTEQLAVGLNEGLVRDHPDDRHDVDDHEQTDADQGVDPARGQGSRPAKRQEQDPPDVEEGHGQNPAGGVPGR
jgi:hypothetical protein